MDKLTSKEIILLLVQLGVLLACSRFFAELARRVKQPAVLGEIIAGIVLGPTLLGAVAPDFFNSLFPMEGLSRLVLDGLVQLSIVLLLFIAGLEVDLHIVWQQGKKSLVVSFFSLVIPFIVGFLVAYTTPQFFGVAEDDALIFSLFMATVMGMTALPVIARILMDLDLFKSSMGMLIISSAMIVDLVCWMIFSIILTMMGSGHQEHSLSRTIWMTIGFTGIMLTIGRGIINYLLPYVNRFLAWPGGLLSLSLVLCFLSAAFTEYIGIHAIFGAFIAGVVLGDSEHMSERAKEILHQFINNIFAPLFFVSIGLYLNLVVSFSLPLVVVIFILAFIGKGIGATVGARISGLKTSQSLAVGMGMNTHGTLEIILSTIALQAGLISEEIFVAILLTVITTILLSAPAVKYAIELEVSRNPFQRFVKKMFREK
ncbi:MAG: cation:proton antiporter [Cyclobacteriaceae bacterium]|nr:MAG: cation:proton antiporter [Cyclobacteriaceae bacterium]